MFFDANIWLCIHGPYTQPSEKQHVYSRAYQEIITHGLSIYIDTNVISEFINAYARFRYKLWCADNTHVEYKHYRSLPEYKPVAIEISDAVNRIMVDSKLVSIKNEKIEFDSLVRQFALGNSDFNDLLIAQTCKKCDFWLVTDDYDFAQDAEIKILTYNQSYLTA